jgi:hypothetical protein
MQKQVEQIPLVNQASFDRGVMTDDSRKIIPKNVISDLREQILVSFAPQDLKKIIIGEIQEQLTLQEINIALDWLYSSTGRKCTALEEVASTSESYAEMQLLFTKMQNSSLPEDRLNLYQQLDSAIKATETSVEIALSTQIAIASAIVAVFPREEQITLTDIKAEVEKERPQIETSVKSQAVIYFFYTYRNLTKAELEEYINFARSPAGSKYHVALSAGLQKALFDSNLKWGRAIADILKKLTSQS